MGKFTIGLVIVAFVAVFMVAVAGTAQNTDEQQKLAKGKELFEAKCSLCHSLDRPLGKNFPQDKWNNIVNSMADKIKNKKLGELTDEQKQLIVNYLFNIRPPKQ